MEDKELKDLINELVSKFKNKLPEENEKLVEAFEKRLLKILLECKDNNYSKDFIVFHLNRITDKLISYNTEQKKQKLLEDENFEKIRTISGEIFNSAINILKKNSNEKSEQQDNKNAINSMKELYNNVEEYNKEEARNLISEAILDLKFIKNPNSEITSFRLAREKKELDYFEEERI